ncbi:MAG: orotidine-5'-phosphate decarboxylase [Thermodesulfovibrionia bacterium]|nr:orotidine-5'-phosphate decarboxylase [Thermodesulfovibrionia bacterium]MCK5511750.1 orotidine-5'-phosphate decarboxylase [Thermodesulfovibrionia bacterium]
MESKGRIILALDVASHDKVINILEKFKEHINIFKVGSELFTAVGPKIIHEIHTRGKKVFLDLKYHDVPHTVQKTARVATELGVFMFTIHTLGGFEMMKKTAQALAEHSLKKNIEKPKLLGITLLTSIDQNTLRDELGIEQSISTQVKHLAELALKAGLDGVVASPQEVEIIRAQCGQGFLVVTPGIRPSWTSSDDQKRIMTPKEALRKGADYLVIGRAIMSQPDPMEALKRIEVEIKLKN